MQEQERQKKGCHEFLLNYYILANEHNEGLLCLKASFETPKILRWYLLDKISITFTSNIGIHLPGAKDGCFFFKKTIILYSL